MAEGRGRGGPARGGGPPPGGRGRGGAFRPAETLNTIPPTVKIVHSDNKGEMKIITNYFRLLTPKDQLVHSYRVDFDPQVESIKTRRGLIWENKAVFDKAYVFDGGNEIKSLTKLSDSTTTITGTRKTDGATITMTLKYTSTVSWGHPEMLRLYNTQMRRNLQHLGYIQVGRDYYDKSAKKLMHEHKLEIWPGMLTAINEHDGGILMVNDMINKIIRSETALDVLSRLHRDYREDFKGKARAEMAGAIVMTLYNNKTYRIDDIVFDKNPTSYTFERRGATISLSDYYREQYGRAPEDDRQPLLLVHPTERQMRGGDNKEIILIPEFCVMTGLTKQMAEDFQFKRALGDLTRLDPTQRANALVKFIRTVNANEKVKDEMRSWGLEFEDKLVEINSRSLTAEKITTFGDPPDGGVLYQQRTGNFEREIRSKQMKKPVKLEKWCLIALRKDKALIDEFFSHLKKVCVPLGIEMRQPKIFPAESDRTPAYIDACRSVPPEAQMVIAVVPNNNLERYSSIKRFFCCEVPIPSQVITTRVLSNKKNLMSVSTKILIQMATKIGAEPWGIHIPPKGCMFIGYDTYHDSQRKGWSVGGFVASSNHTSTSWFARAAYHENREELTGNFAGNMRSSIKNWVNKNNSWPERIIIYRDGVSEGQIQHVFNVEMKQVQEVLKERPELASTSFVFIIVTKRVNARFFWNTTGTRDLINPPPGAIIDSIVTRKERYDFYLISQSVRQGTVNPTMYNIIADNTSWKVANHQQLAYKLCHLYYNWAGTITVPAPCQYAHKLAYLTGTSLHREHHQDLSYTLFFL